MARIDCIYINLAAAADRRAFLERNFAESGVSPDFGLERLEAADVERVKSQAVPGRLRDAEKACFLSHLDAIALAAARPSHVLIAEDDILFCARSAAAIQGAIGAMPSGAWDLLFTDICVPLPADMLHLFAMRRAMMKSGQVTLIDLARMSFCGSTAYIVNAASKEKVRAALARPPELSAPYDLFLRERIWNGHLKAFVAFPFATSLSSFADSSAIQNKDEAEYLRNLCWNSFRRLAWIGGDPGSVDKALDAVRPDFADPSAGALSKILKTMLAEQFVQPSAKPS